MSKPDTGEGEKATEVEQLDLRQESTRLTPVDRLFTGDRNTNNRLQKPEQIV